MTEMKWNSNSSNYVCRVPEGLRELCSDISREVLRTQPKNIYCFIADYVDARLVRQDISQVAVQIVNNALRDSELIVNTLNCIGFDLKKIAAAAPQLQNAFRSYLDDIDSQLSHDRDASITRCSDQSSAKTAEDPVQNTDEIPCSFRYEYEDMQPCISNPQQQTSTAGTIGIPCRADVTSKRERRKYSVFR